MKDSARWCPGWLVALTRGLAVLLLSLGAASSWPALAHEVRPALLQITAQGSHAYEVLWKQPMVGDMAVHLEPHISGGALDRPPDRLEVQPGFRVKVWHLRNMALDGRSITIEGLSSSVTDVLLRVDLGNGNGLNSVIRPSQSSYRLDLSGPKGISVPGYFRMGVEHILTGIDHLLFVFGLFLLVGPGWRLVKAVTAFTVAHSITLGLAALGFIHFPSAVIEVMVALSIVFVAWELVRGPASDSLAFRCPWLIAFTFGLLHGLAFAGALADVGLPAGQAPAALLLFNLGVEAGQLAFIAAVLFAFALLRSAPFWNYFDRSRSARLAPAYLIGGLAAYWMIERVVAAIAVPA